MSLDLTAERHAGSSPASGTKCPSSQEAKATCSKQGNSRVRISPWTPLAYLNLQCYWRVAMNCEYCNEPHDGIYGSGRFCSAKCARGFTTKAKRAEINAKVSATLRGRSCSERVAFKKGYDPRRKIFSNEDRKRATSVRLQKIEENWPIRKASIISGSETSKRFLRKVLLEEMPRCNDCGINDWLGTQITLEIHHMDGNPRNNVIGNVELLCPNCHSLTPNHRNKKRSTGD